MKCNMHSQPTSLKPMEDNNAMADNTEEETPFHKLYLQIEHADSSFAILGLSSEPTEVEVRESYHSLALRIHPDRAPDYLRELHTSLFQKVQAAYEDILKRQFDQSDEHLATRPKRLPETFESLHARNVAFQEALRSQREKAIKSKRAADALKESKLAHLQAKNERLAKQREARVQALEQDRKNKKEGAEKRINQITKRVQNTADRDRQDRNLVEAEKEEPAFNWEQEAERLEAEEDSEAVIEQQEDVPVRRPGNGTSKGFIKGASKGTTKGASRHSKRAPQSLPTARTARTMWEDGIDERLVPGEEIKDRWNKQLLSGGRSGTVSLSQKKQRERNGAATAHKQTMALCEEADHTLKSALKSNNMSGNHRFSGIELEKKLESAFEGAELKLEARTDRMLGWMDEDVREQYLIEDGHRVRPVDLLDFVSQ